MPTVTCTIGGSADNSYVTMAQANAYYANGLRESEWNSHELEQRQRAVIDSTKRIEALGGPKDLDGPARAYFLGTPYVDTQALHFPRTTDLTDSATKIIPETLRDAVCEQALYMLAPPKAVSDHDTVRADGISNWSADGMSVTYRGRERPDGIAPAAWAKVKPYLRGGGVACRTRA